MDHGWRILLSPRVGDRWPLETRSLMCVCLWSRSGGLAYTRNKTSDRLELDFERASFCCLPTKLRTKARSAIMTRVCWYWTRPVVALDFYLFYKKVREASSWQSNSFGFTRSGLIFYWLPKMCELMPFKGVCGYETCCRFSPLSVDFAIICFEFLLGVMMVLVRPVDLPVYLVYLCSPVRGSFALMKWRLLGHNIGVAFLLQQISRQLKGLWLTSVWTFFLLSLQPLACRTIKMLFSAIN